MKKRILVLAVLLISVFTVSELFAFGREGRHSDRKGYGMGPGYGSGDYRYIDVMKDQLGLSDKQVKQIFDIGTQYREKYFENRSNPDKLAELRTEHFKAVENVLTKEQLEKYNKIKNDSDRNGRNRKCPCLNW